MTEEIKEKAEKIWLDLPRETDGLFLSVQLDRLETLLNHFLGPRRNRAHPVFDFGSFNTHIPVVKSELELILEQNGLSHYDYNMLEDFCVAQGFDFHNEKEIKPCGCLAGEMPVIDPENWEFHGSLVHYKAFEKNKHAFASIHKGLCDYFNLTAQHTYHLFYRRCQLPELEYQVTGPYPTEQMVVNNLALYVEIAKQYLKLPF